MGALREILCSFGYEIDHAELSKGEAGINHMVESIGALGRHIGEAFAAYEIKEFVQKTVEGALQLNHAAIIAGTTAEKLQSLQFAAEASEVPVEALSMGLMRLQRAMFASGNGAMGAGSAFKALGLDQKDLKTMDSTQAFVQVAQAISEVKNPAEQTALAMKVFGRGGAQLLPLLKEGKEGIAKLRGEVVALGGGYSGQYLENSKKYKEETVRLGMAWRSFSVLLTDRLVPAMTWVTDKIMGIIVGINHLSESVDIGRVGLAAFAAVAIAGLSTVLPLITAFAIKSALPIAGWILLGLAIEDIVGLFQGDTSLSGTLIDKFFGKDSASTFVTDVEAMIQTWDTFLAGVNNLAGTIGAEALLSIINKVIKLGTEVKYLLRLIDPFEHIGAAIGGESAGDFNKRIKADRDKSFAETDENTATDRNVNRAHYRETFDAIRDAAATAHLASGREAQLNQSKPVAGGIELGPGKASFTPSQVPGYMTSPQYFVDKSSTVVQTMPGTTDGQVKAIGSAVAKARRETSEYKGASYALEDVVE
jgi:methyl-accepting chemotaxis protein